MSTQLMSRWIHGTKSSRPALRAELKNDPDRLITFHDFVQAMAVRSIRIDSDRIDGKPFSIQKIRSVIDKAKDLYNIDYPFARRHKIYLFEDDVVLVLPNDGNVFVQLTGKYEKHYLINAVVEHYAEHLEYDSDTGYANRFKAWISGASTVELSPDIRFGEPMVYRDGILCGVSVEELVNARYTEGSLEAAAHVHGVDKEDVLTALRYYDWMETP